MIHFLYNLTLLLRPKQWIKNLFVFLPLFFGGRLFDANSIVPAFVTFLSLCMASGGIYCLNDICDLEADKLHPIKKKRPIASGKINVKSAYALMLLSLILSFGIILVNGASFSGGGKILWVIASYVVMNLFYCVWLKHIAIVDVVIISIGFVLRVLIGGFASGIHLSHWIVLMTFLLALFLSIAKRRDDVVLYENTGQIPRNNIKRYNLWFLNEVLSIVACITIVCYIMYTVSPEVIERFKSQYLYLTTIFVLVGIIRYLQLAIVDMNSGSPTMVLLKDNFIQTCIVGWIISFLFIIYF